MTSDASGNEDPAIKVTASDGEIVPLPDDEVDRFFEGSQYAKYGRFILAALSVIPWIGGMIGAGGCTPCGK
jgi:hypothetical protein